MRFQNKVGVAFVKVKREKLTSGRMLVAWVINGTRVIGSYSIYLRACSIIFCFIVEQRDWVVLRWILICYIFKPTQYYLIYIESYQNEQILGLI